MGFLFWFFNTKMGMALNAFFSYLISKFFVYTVLSKWVPIFLNKFYIPDIFDFYDLRFFIFVFTFYIVWLILNYTIIPYFFDLFFEKDHAWGGLPITGGTSMHGSAFHDVSDS